MSSIQVLTDFKNNLVQFFDALIELFPQESDFVLMRILIKDQIPIQEVMNIFITNILPHKALIRARDDKTIMNLSFVPETSSSVKGKIGNLRRIWLSPDLDDENRDTIWAWLNSFVALVEKYQKAVLAESK